MFFIVFARFEMFREIRELFEAVIEEHEESLDESDPRQESNIIDIARNNCSSSFWARV